MPLGAEVIHELAYYAALAPSPHNAQPWRIDYQDEEFAFSLDPARQVLRALDPASLEGQLACGAAVANLCAAARALGFVPAPRWLPAGAPARLCAVRLAPAERADPASLGLVTTRSVNRSTYLARPVPAGALASLGEIAREEGFRLRVLETAAETEAVARLAARAGAIKLAHRETHDELYRLMRFTPRAAAAERDGLAADLFSLPAATRLVFPVLFHPHVMGALAGLGYAKLLAHTAEAAPVRAAPAVCLLTAGALDDGTFLRGGHAFERIALEATRAGLGLQPHSAPIEVQLGRYASPPRAVGADAEDVAASLRSAFGCGADEVPIVLFRLGFPAGEPRHRSLRRRLPRLASAAPPPVPSYAERVMRNAPVVRPDEQEALRGLRIVCAGCGSIGGAPIEMLARMGAEHFLLLEPGTYEPNNLNRQHATLADMGRNKAEVLRERVLAISPGAQVLVDTRGVTEENVHYVVGSSDIILDGVDVTEEGPIRAKRLLHEEAWRQRRVVVLGLDLGGTQLVQIYDYRSGRVKPLGGRIRAPLDAALTSRAFLASLIPVSAVPLEMVEYAVEVLAGRASSAPQLSPTAELYGVLAAWAVLDFAAGRPLRAEVRVDIPGLLSPLRRRLRDEGVRLVKMVQLQRLLARSRTSRDF